MYGNNIQEMCQPGCCFEISLNSEVLSNNKTSGRVGERCPRGKKESLEGKSEIINTAIYENMPLKHPATNGSLSSSVEPDKKKGDVHGTSIVFGWEKKVGEGRLGSAKDPLTASRGGRGGALLWLRMATRTVLMPFLPGTRLFPSSFAPDSRGHPVRTASP